MRLDQSKSVHPGNPAYVICASGSMGAPKGTVGTGENLADLEPLLPLIGGGWVVLASKEPSQDPYALGKLMSASGATVMQATPALWESPLASGHPVDGAALRAFVGGEAPPGRHARPTSPSP